MAKTFKIILITFVLSLLVGLPIVWLIPGEQGWSAGVFNFFLYILFFVVVNAWMRKDE
jgi:hypothetical protein